tara:strand:- start:2567 stop:4648 length:2082 start_codon:yes stop_codon:yes gene_type:complete
MALKDLLIRVGIRGDKKAKKAIGGVEKSTKSLAATALKLGSVFFAAKGVINAFQKVTELSAQQELAEKKLNAVLKSTGGIAGITAKELTTMASGLQEVTSFGDEAVMGAQSLLLTFTKVGKDVFPQATETILNMSSAMGQDLRSTTLQLGKALNDPVKGISALSRVGVQLTEDQKNQIKTFSELGDIAGAQKVILGELETQFGGLARASAQTTDGALSQMKNLLGDLGEDIGDLFVPNVIGSANAISEMAVKGIEVVDFLKKLDFTKTGKNMIESSKLLIDTYKALLGNFIDFIPDLFKNAFNKIAPILKTLFDNILNGVKSVAQVLWEPLVIAFDHIVQVIRSGFVGMVNFMISGMNNLLDKVRPIGEKFGMVFPEINLLDKVDVDSLSDKLLKTKLGEKIFGGPDEITNFQEYTDAQAEILKNYFEQVRVMKEEEDLVEDERRQANLDKDKEANDERKISHKQVFDGMKQLADASMNLATNLYNHEKTLLDNKMNDEIKSQQASFQNLKKSIIAENTINGKLTEAGQAKLAELEEGHNATINNIKEEYRQKNIAAQKKLKPIKLAQAITNTAVAVTGALGNPPFSPFNLALAALVGAAGLAEIKTIQAQEFAQGGLVGGVGNKDTVPAMLTPGEFVMTRQAVDQLGVNTLEQMNQGEGGGITLNISAPLVDETIIDTIIPKIQEAQRLNLA